MIKSVTLFFLSYLFFIIIDMVWIGAIARNHYLAQLGPLLRYSDGSYNVIWWAALLVWFFIVLGSFIFVLPIAQDKSLVHALYYGALFGLVLYGVYDLTNYSLLKNWPLSTTLLDIAWGATVNALLSGFMWFVVRFI